MISTVETVFTIDVVGFTADGMVSAIVAVVCTAEAETYALGTVVFPIVTEAFTILSVVFTTGVLVFTIGVVS